MEKTTTTTDALEISIAKAKEEMSPDSLAAINAVSWKLILSGINNKYTPEQIDTLETETELLLCGLINTENYPKELEARMHLHKSEVAILINEIDKLIFKKIQEELEKRLAQGGTSVKPKIDTPSFIFDPVFQNLPKVNQEAISSSKWKEEIYKISKKYNINIEQTGLLEEITTKALAGTIRADQYESEVKSKIGLPDDKSREMVGELNDSVFKKVKELMISYTNRPKAPLPPYSKNKEVPLPPIMQVNKLDIKEEPILQQNTKETDPYREHGIEIMSDNVVNKNYAKSEVKKEEIPLSKNQEIIKNIEKPQSNTFIDGTIHTTNTPNIFTNKLMSKTVSNTITTDYTIPKMGGVSHDPYHEEI